MLAGSLSHRERLALPETHDKRSAEPAPGRLGPAVLLDRGSLDTGDLDDSALAAACGPWRFHPATAPADTARRVAEAEVVVTNKVVIEAVQMDAAPALRLVCIAATGTNNVDLDAARARGIAVTNVTGYATPAVVQHVFALLLDWAVGLRARLAAVHAGAWSASPHFCLLPDTAAGEAPIRELAGLRLGIVGHGELGRAVAQTAAAFGMRVLVAQRPGTERHPPPPGRLALPRLLPQVDVLSLHCPLAENTRNLIGAPEMAAMRPGALLINTARGGLVDEAALAAALRSGRLGAAALDTLSREPPPADHPLLAPDIPNLAITPHVAWASAAARQRLIDEVAANIRAFAAGERRNRVD